MARYRVTCKDCDLNEVYNDDDPPQRDIKLYGSIESAKRNWDAESAAMGARDNHRFDRFRDYAEGIRHRPMIEKIE